MFKKSYCVSLLLGLIFNFCYLQPTIAEDITITTYYPSPFGSYNELTANQMKIGAVYSAAATAFEPDGLLVEGSVGIGTSTPASVVKLDIAGTENFGVRYLRTIRDARIGIGDPVKTWSWATGWATAGDFSLIEEGVAGNRLYVKQGTGNLGIGTSNPLSKLVVTGSGTTSATSALNVARSDGNSSLFVRDDGRVGVGITTPVCALDVLGNGPSSGYLHVAGNVNPSTPSQGAYLGWNALTGGTGETDFINQKGGGIGGFAFIESTTTGVRTPLMTLDNNGLRIRNSFQDKIILEGSNASPNTIVWTNDKGLRFWDPILGQIMSITRAGSTGSVNISSVAVPLTFYETDTGSLWRMPLDGGVLRFDKNTGSSFSSYYTPIALASGPYALYAVGSIYATGGWAGSDLRWKKHIETLDNPLNKLLKLRGVSFEWKKEEFEKNGFFEGKQIGVIAQEMEEQFPELVQTDEKGYKAIAYDKFTAVLLEGIKAQQAEIKELKARLEKIEAVSKK